MADQHKVSVGHLAARFENVGLPMGLNVDEMSLEVRDAVLVHPPFSLNLDEPGWVVAKVSPASLEKFLLEKAPGNVKFKGIKFGKGKIAVEAAIRMVFEISAVAICYLEIEEGKRLVVKLDSVEVMGVGAKSLVQKQIDELNPLLETDDLPINLVMESVEISPEWITLSGSVAMQDPADPQEP